MGGVIILQNVPTGISSICHCTDSMWSQLGRLCVSGPASLNDKRVLGSILERLQCMPWSNLDLRGPTPRFDTRSQYVCSVHTDIA